MGTKIDVPDTFILKSKKIDLPPISINIDDLQHIREYMATNLKPIPENENFNIKEVTPFNYEIEIKSKDQLVTLLKRLGIQLIFGLSDSAPIGFAILPDSYLHSTDEIGNLSSLKSMISDISRNDWESINA